VTSGWVRGLSDRDIEAALGECSAPEAAPSKSTVSRICQRLRTEFDAWKTRDLPRARLDYLFLDGSHLQDAPRRPRRTGAGPAGIDTDGRPVFVGLAPAASESTDAWDDFLADLCHRGLPAPLLGISDGAAGLCGAFDRAFTTSLRRRCLIHRARYVVAKVSKHDQAEVKADFWKVFDVHDAEPGDKAITVANRQAGEFAAKWKTRYPSAVACVTDDLESLTVHLRFPAEHDGSGTQTSSSAPSARPAGGSRSSAGSPARTRACRSCGRTRPRQPQMARPHHETQSTSPPAGRAPPAPPPAHRRGGQHRTGHSGRISTRNLRPEPFTQLLARHPTPVFLGIWSNNPPRPSR